MKWKPVVPVLALLCAMLGAATPLLAQAVQTSTLTGTVRDSTGAVLPAVMVTLAGFRPASSRLPAWTAPAESPHP